MKYKILGALALSMLASGYQTYSLLSKTAAEEYIEVVSGGTSEDIEASLKSSGVKYTCKEFFYGNHSAKNSRACYIKAPEKNRFNALGIKLQDAPEAVLTDAGNAILVVGKAAINLYLLKASVISQGR